MRIRRRQPPFLLPSLPPAPPSDLPPNPSPPVQHHHHHMVSHPHENLSPQQSQVVHFRPPPPDQANQRVSPTGTGAGGWDCPETEKKECLELGGDEEVKDERLRDGEKSNDTRKGSTIGAETGSGVLPFSSSSGEAGRWGEGEKAFPLKKRRRSFERGGGGVPMNQETIMEKEKKMKTKMKTKMNKKFVQENDDDQEEHGSEGETKHGFDSTTATASGAGAKKRSRGGALMEGSRCSRVNGRGWRCCQQTLVGYSLCEHHLGKGRLRSMSSVRVRAAAARNQTQELFNNSLSQSPHKTQEQEHKEKEIKEHHLLEDHKGEAAVAVAVAVAAAAVAAAADDHQKPLTGSGGGGAKKRVKIGMVKARSLSSLLGQPSSVVAVTAASAIADDNK